MTIEPRGLVATVEGADHLVGVRCTHCGTHAFPEQSACPRCGGATELVALPNAGAVWSWTVQRIRPKPPYEGPEEFEPFAVGYVDLGPLKVEGRLDGRTPDDWSIGDAVELRAGGPDRHGAVRRFRWVAADGGGR